MRLSEADPQALEVVLKLLEKSHQKPEPPLPDDMLTEKGRQNYAVAIAEHNVVQRVRQALKLRLEK